MDKKRLDLTKYAWLSLVAAVATMGLKSGAYKLTGSLGLLADALESGVNLLTAMGTMLTLIVAARPPDMQHSYGHSKAEYFSTALNGLLILVAAIAIVYSTFQRWLNPQPIEQLQVGLAVSVVAAVLNFVVARILARAGQAHNSISLTAEGRHLMTDVWTSIGVLIGVGLVWLTGRPWLDGVVALLVAAQIGWSGGWLLYEALQGLMDQALPEEEVHEIIYILDRFSEQEGVQYHALRTRRAGARRFVSVHVQVPGSWSIQDGHDLLEEIEAELRTAVPDLSVFTHLEPLEDPRSWHDIELMRS